MQRLKNCVHLVNGLITFKGNIDLNIQIINVEKATRQGPKTSYVQLEVAYKDLNGGKVGSRKVMSFNNKSVYDMLADAKNGEQYKVTPEKKGDFWEWVTIERLTGGSAANADAGGTSQKQSSAGNAVQSRGNWETPEERAQRQVYIIRQSSLSNAISTLVAGAKTPPKASDVINLAKEYEDYVFGKSVKEALKQDNNEIPAFPDDDNPF